MYIVLSPVPPSFFCDIVIVDMCCDCDMTWDADAYVY